MSERKSTNTDVCIGSIYGSWTVIAKTGPLHSRKDGCGNRHTMWLCRCICGLERTVDGMNLKAGRSRQCGSCRWNVQVGDGLRRCKNCGNQYPVADFEYKVCGWRGGMFSCEECRNKSRKNSKKRRDELRKMNPFLYRTLKFLAKRLNKIDPDITVSWLECLFRETKHCTCCGQVLTAEIKPISIMDYAYPTVDRRDNTVHYTRENIAIICGRCNNRKSDMSVSDVEMLLAYMTKRNNAIA